MKKFKYRKRNINYKLVILLIVFLIVFILLSTIKLNNSNKKIIELIFNNTYLSDKQANYLTSNLNNLTKSYFFKKSKTPINNSFR